MNAHPLLAELHRAGCQLSVVSGEIKVKGSKSFLTPDVLARLKVCKAEIMSILQAPAAPRDVSPPTVDTFEERAAMLSGDGEIYRNEAVTLAAREYGFASHDEFCHTKIAEWAGKLTVIPSDLPSEILKLYMRTRLFLRERHAFTAVKLGWDEISSSAYSLAKAWSAARRARPRAWHSARLPGYTIMSIGNDAAMVRAVSGGALRHPRFQSGAQYAVVWWKAINRSLQPRGRGTRPIAEAIIAPPSQRSHVSQPRKSLLSNAWPRGHVQNQRVPNSSHASNSSHDPKRSPSGPRIETMSRLSGARKGSGDDGI